MAPNTHNNPPTLSHNNPPTLSHKLANDTVANDDATTTATDLDNNHLGTQHNPSTHLRRNPETQDNGQVKDLGWHEVGDSANLPEPLLAKKGLAPDPDANKNTNHDVDHDHQNNDEKLAPVVTNEELFTLLRRFNKNINHVKCTHTTPPSKFDLEIPPDETFTVFKFRTRLEQFYMTIGVGLVSAYKHLVRLRSWQEWRRTSSFLYIYAMAWYFDVLLSTLFSMLLVLAVYPPSRGILFPHAPPALISEAGDLKKPMTNVLASDSLTGAPESHPGEAIEQEAHSFVNAIVELAMGLATGESPEKLANIKDKTGGDFTETEHDKTKKPVSDAVWEEALPVMHLIGVMADFWERAGNALDPRWPFGEAGKRFRFVLGGMLGVLIFGGLVVPGWLIVKGLGFAIGFLLFGDPVIMAVVGWLDRAYPVWREYLSLKTTILKGVPTNAQLTLTLLRIGERNYAPIPPPPGGNDPLPMDAHPTAGEGLDKLLNVSPAEVDHAIQPSPQAKEEADGNLREKKKSKPNIKDRMLGGAKHIARGLVNSVRGADRAAAHVNFSQSAKYRAGVVRTGPLPAKCTGPVRFPARRDGKRGYAVIHYGEAREVDEAVLGWVSGDVPDEGDMDKIGNESDKMDWKIDIGDIYEMQKIGGLGWKSKILVGWAMDGEITDGIVIRDRAGTEYHLTAISFRDELFNRLVAIGGQMWESW
ncbi:Protein of unknown function (DUF3292) domain containing protein [Rhypophila decipiens]